MDGVEALNVLLNLLREQRAQDMEPQLSYRRTGSLGPWPLSEHPPLTTFEGKSPSSSTGCDRQLPLLLVLEGGEKEE
jgi:hypothetical protein